MSNVAQLRTHELSALLRFLGRLWLRELDELAKTELLNRLAAPWQSMGGALPTESLAELQADFCQLFSNPKSYVAPFQSVWTTGQLDGAPAQSMRRYLSDTGYALQVVTDEVPDHLGVQLDLAGWMLAQSLADEANEALIVEVAERCIRTHLQWAGPMLDRAESVAETEFYRGLIRVTRCLLSEV